jgi:glycine/D-amino acid oxidase-like deaminating enzyme
MAAEKAVVIGGGIIGNACAASLAEGGFSVTLLERKELACAASGGNVGQISVIDRAEPWHMRLTLNSLKTYREISEKEDLEFSQDGGSILIENDDDFDQAEKLQKEMKTFDVPSEILEGNDVLRYLPGADLSLVKGIFYCPWEGTINPLKTVMYFRDRAVRAGAEIREHCPVESFRKEGSVIRSAHTPEGDFEADYFINCAGSWASGIGKMAGVPTRLNWRRGTAMITQPIPVIARGQMCGHALFGGTSEVIGGNGSELISLGIVQTKDGGVLIAQATKYTDADDKDITLSGVSGVAAGFIRHFPCCRGTEILRMWSAVTPFSDDGNPFFGFGKNAVNLLTAAGFKGAFTTSPEIARETVRALKGHSELLDSKFSPDREVKGYHAVCE